MRRNHLYKWQAELDAQGEVALVFLPGAVVSCWDVGYTQAVILACLVALIIVAPAVANAVQAPEPRPELIPHLDAIAALARSSPMVPVQEGWFLMGTNLKHGDPSGMATQFDDTEQPQRRIWLDAFEIDRDEVSLSEYLAFLKAQEQLPSEELQGLIWHLLTVHFMPDYVPARWPALYVSWSEAAISQEKNLFNHSLRCVSHHFR